MLKFLAKGEISKGNCEGKMSWGLKTLYFKLMEISKVVTFGYLLSRGMGHYCNQVVLFLWWWGLLLVLLLLLPLARKSRMGNVCQGKPSLGRRWRTVLKLLWYLGVYWNFSFHSTLTTLILLDSNGTLWGKWKVVFLPRNTCLSAPYTVLQSLWMMSKAQVFCVWGSPYFSKSYCLKFSYLCDKFWIVSQFPTR